MITYEIPRLYLNEFIRKYLGRYQKRTLKMETTITYANHVLTSVLVKSNCQEPV